MPIKINLHDSTSQVQASGNSGTISDKRLEFLLDREIQNRIDADEHLQEEIDKIIEGGAWYLLIEEKENGSIDISLLNKNERVLCTETIHLTEKIIKEGILDYEHSKIIYTCNDNSTIELDISDIVSAIHQLEDDLAAEVARATNAEEALDDKIDKEIQDRIDDVDAEELRATTKEDAIASDLSDEIARATTSEQTINTRIDNLDLNTIGQDGSYIKTVGQQDGQLSATKQAFDVDMSNATNNNAPTTKNAKDYTDAQVTIENNRAIAQETLLGQEIDAEEERALHAEETLQANIESEETRAKGVENSLSQAISSETTARTNADTTLQSNIDAEETRAKGVEATLSTNIANEETRAREAETALGTRIDNLDLSQVGANGSYIKLISQENGRVSASSQAFDTTIGSNSSDNNAPTSKAVKDYVDTYGGKIDSISIDGTNQPIVNKNVDLPAYPTRVSLSIDNVDNTSDLNKPISTATQAALDTKQDNITSSNMLSSDLVDDANKTHKFATSAQLSQIATNTSDISDLNTALTNHKNDIANPHEVKAAQIGLGNVDNTSDMNKPVSTAQQNAINAVDDKLNANVHIEGNSDEITYNGDTVTKTSPYKNLKTGVTGSRSEVIHLANTTTAGMMSPADYNQIRDNTSRIEALEGTKVRIEYTTSSNPTSAQIKTFVDNYLATRGIVNPTDEDYNSVSVVVKDTKHIWNYYANSQAYQDDGLDTVTQFTNSVAGIILGSSSDGQVYAENNGTGSVYGWSALKTRVSNLETDDASLQQSVTNLENNKVDKVSGKGLSTNDFTNAYKDDVDANTTARHTHSNKTILDNTTASFTTSDKSNLDANTSARHTHSNKALLDEYAQTEANLADAVAKKHSHSNKAILDATEESFTTTLKNKLDGIQAGAEVNVNADWNASSGDAQILNKPNLAVVATSGDYNDLINKPSIPTDTNQKIKQGSVTFGDNDVINFVGGNHVTISGNASDKSMTLGVESGYSIPSNSSQTSWSNKYDKPSGGIPDSDIASASTWNAKQDALQTQTAYTTKGSDTKVPQITTNSLGQVTGITEITITQPFVYDGTLTIQKNGTTVATFTANQSTNATANISVPTNLDEIADGSSRKLSDYLPLSGGTSPVHFNDNNLPQFSGSIPYFVGIEAFADGGTLKWQSASDVSVGYASSAGNADTLDGYHASDFALKGWVNENFLGKTAKAADSDKLDNHDSTYFINTDNIGSQSVNYANSSNYANSAGNADTVDNKHASDFLPYMYKAIDVGVNNLTMGVTSSQIAQTGQYGNNHSVFLYFDGVGTPFQLQIPDSSEPYIYKRYNSGGTWSGWNKISAGYADSAGNADTLDNHDSSYFYPASNPSGFITGITQQDVTTALNLGIVNNSTNWGTLTAANGYTVRWGSDQPSGGGLVFAEKSGQTSMQVDGEIYVNEGSVRLAHVGEAQPASDVYSWAKQPSKPSYNFSEIQPGTAVVDYSGGVVFRNETSSWYSGIYYSTPNEEAVVFANKSQGNQDNAYQQQWLFAYTDMQNRTAWTDLGSSVAMQIKGHRVAINKMMGVSQQIPYNLDVNGSANATTITINTKATMQYNSTEDCLDFIFA